MASEEEVQFAPVFAPTVEEFKEFGKYIEKIRPQCTGGICKIIPPKEWNQALSQVLNYEELDVVIPHPIQQIVEGNKGIYQLLLLEKPKITLSQFKKAAEKEVPPKSTKYGHEHDSVEQIFWKNVRFSPPMYGADMLGSLFNDKINDWNLNHLKGSILEVLNANLPGITQPYLYFGMWKAMFAWHVEDMNLFSINYLHFGAPKSWYCVAPENGPKLERLAQSYFPEQYKQCPEFLRHKTSMIAPQILQKNGIPFTRAIQEQGQFIITFPYAYHMGFNYGFNCAEAVNFALDSWIEYGMKAGLCKCVSDSVSINMAIFLERYNEWKNGRLTIEKKIEIPTDINAGRMKITNSPQKEKTSPKKNFPQPSEAPMNNEKPVKSPIKKLYRDELAPKKSKTRRKKEEVEDEPSEVDDEDDELNPEEEFVQSEEEVDDEEISEEEEFTHKNKRKSSDSNTNRRSSLRSKQAKYYAENSEEDEPLPKDLSPDDIRILRHYLVRFNGNIPPQDIAESLAVELNWNIAGVNNWFKTQLRRGAKEEFHIWNAEAQALAANKTQQKEKKAGRKKKQKKEENVTISHDEQKIIPKISPNKERNQKNTTEPLPKKQKRNVEQTISNQALTTSFPVWTSGFFNLPPPINFPYPLPTNNQNILPTIRPSPISLEPSNTFKPLNSSNIQSLLSQVTNEPLPSLHQMLPSVNQLFSLPSIQPRPPGTPFLNF